MSKTIQIFVFIVVFGLVDVFMVEANHDSIKFYQWENANIQRYSYMYGYSGGYIGDLWYYNFLTGEYSDDQFDSFPYFYMYYVDYNWESFTYFALDNLSLYSDLYGQMDTYNTYYLGYNGITIYYPNTPLTGWYGTISTETIFRFEADGIWSKTVLFTNLLQQTQSIDLDVYGDLGCDSNCVVSGTSSGDTTVTNADRWLIVGDSNSYDPTTLFVWEGTGSALASDTASLNSYDNIEIFINIVLVPDQTVGVIVFGFSCSTFSDTICQNTASTIFDNDANIVAAGYADFLTNTQRSQIVNFDLAIDPSPSPSPSRTAAPTPSASSAPSQSPTRTQSISKSRSSIVKYFSPEESSASTLNTLLVLAITLISCVAMLF